MTSSFMLGGILNREFYLQDTRKVARNLLGKLLVREYRGRTVSGVIVETEAYRGFNDTASHAHKGPTERCKVMFGDAGFAYVYLTYGIHNMFNIVTEERYFPSAVLIRAIEPFNGTKSENSGEKKTDGPGKLTKELKIDRSLNGIDLTVGKQIWIEEVGEKDCSWINRFEVCETQRIGIDYAQKKDIEKNWRYYIKDNLFVSR